MQRTYTFSAEAIEPVRLCRFSRTKLRAMLDDFPAMEKRLLETATNELVAAQEQMLLLGRKTAHERIASFLIAQARGGPPCTEPRRAIHLPMTRADIADYLGLTIETVSRTFSRLKTEKLIALPGSTEVVFLEPHAPRGESPRQRLNIRGGAPAEGAPHWVSGAAFSGAPSDMPVTGSTQTR